MRVLTIISNFLDQYLPDFSEFRAEYILLAILIIILAKGVFNR